MNSQKDVKRERKKKRKKRVKEKEAAYEEILSERC